MRLHAIIRIQEIRVASRNHADPPFLGYVVGSLALIADAYHMLNDVMSLAIGLYAIKVRFFPCIFLRFMSAH